MTTMFISALITFGIFSTFGGGLSLYRRLRRQSGARLPAGEPLVRQVQGASARVFVERDVLGGPKSMSVNSTRADLSMSDARLLIATHHGRVLELTRDQPGAVRCTGPRRLVIEGARQRADGPMRVRAEVIVDDAERWAQEAAARIGARQIAMAL
ncbi:MAG: hypothetical protein RIT28_3060 [Pseudomonadota bacterium]|jgi:hypothetical protein